MFKPVSTLTLISCAALNAYIPPGSAISREAQTVTEAAFNIREVSDRSQLLFGKKADAISQLRAIAQDCAESDWHGNQASAIDAIALCNAESFVRAMPDGLPFPEFSPEPDGSISLDWIQSRHQVFSLSIGRSNRLAFAWLDGTDKGHGVVRFDGTNIPPRVAEGIRLIKNV